MRRSFPILCLTVISTFFASQSVPALGFEVTRVITIWNSSNKKVKELYARKAGAKNWEYNLLQESEVLDEETTILNVDDEIEEGVCIVDLKAVLDDGEIKTTMRINVCKAFEHWKIK